MSLEALVKKKKQHFTVIVTVLVVLEAHLRAFKLGRPFEGLKIAEITAEYNKLAKKFGQKNFFPSYINRHNKAGDFFREVKSGRYVLRSNLTAGKLKRWEKLRGEILRTLGQQSKAKLKVLGKLDDLINESLVKIPNRYNYILQRLDSAEGNRGQNFEVISFGILSTYFSALGFSLKRFSVTFSNDGGMDFFSGDAIYQVTTAPTDAKLTADLSKLPGVARVVVAPKFSQKAITLIGDEVLERIDHDDLVNHVLKWLYERDKKTGKAHYLQRILETARREYSRDFGLS